MAHGAIGPDVRSLKKRLNMTRSDLLRHEVDRPVDRPKHPVEFVTAPEDEPGCGDDAVGALPLTEPWIFFDAVYGNFGRPSEYRKYGAISQKVDGVVPPLAFGDLASVETEYAAKFAPVERHFSGNALDSALCGGGEPCNARTLSAWTLAWIDVARTFCHGRLLFHRSVMSRNRPVRKARLLQR